MSKNIETCKSEEVLASVTEQQPQDYPSVQQAVHDLGVTALPAASAADPHIDELPSNVEVFVRRVLKAVVYDRVLPVVQQMWQAVLNRCSDYLPDTLYPYASNPSLRTLGTLPTALSALSVRKIDCGSMNVPDGMCLWRIFGNKAMQDQIAASMQGGNDEGWVYDSTAFNNWFVMFAEAEDLIIPCGSATVNPLNNATLGNGTLKTKRIIFPFAKSFKNFSWHSGSGLTPMESATVWVNEFFDLIAPELLTTQGPYGIMGWGCPKLRKLWFPKLTTGLASVFYNNMAGGFDRLICLNIGELTTSTNMGGWTASMALRTDTTASDYVDLREDLTIENNLQQFLQNFLHHIAERLAVGPTTNRLTLTLSADVYSACGFGCATIDDTTDIRYQIKKAIQDRNWKVTDGTNNFNQ